MKGKRQQNPHVFISMDKRPKIKKIRVPMR